MDFGGNNLDFGGNNLNFSFGIVLPTLSLTELHSVHSRSELGDGSKPKGIEGDVSQIEGKGASDESINSKEEAKSNSSPRKKEGFHGEECDPSNMCTDEQSQFVACLRVPDAAHLSLLIQNKAKGALIVSITGPRFVRLDKNKVELLENQDTKVKVYSIKNKKGGSNGRSIILTSTTGRCSLELKDLAATHETVNHDTAAVSRPTILNIGRFVLPTLSLTELHYGHFQSFSVVC